MKIWLISSKDIEELSDPAISSDKKAIHTENSKEYNIFCPELNEPGFVSMGTFYYDLYLQSIDNNDIVIKNDLSYKEGEISVDPEIFEEGFLKGKLRNTVEEPSSFLELKVWKLLNDFNKDEAIFYTRCIPNKEKVIMNFPLLDEDESIYLNHYWLVAYIETAFRILSSEEHDLTDLTINFLLHDSDIKKNREIGVIAFANFFNDTRYFDDATKYFNKISGEARIYYYQHSIQSFFYRNIICKESFFNDNLNPAQKLDNYVNLAKMSTDFISSISQI